jgi:DNA mismatch endonuclease, patch repair protein
VPLRGKPFRALEFRRARRLLARYEVEALPPMADTVSPSDRSRIMAAVKSKDTTPELLVRRLVHSLGYRYRLHVRALPGTPDLVFPRLRKIINVNGCFWHLHRCPKCRVPSSRRRYWNAKLKRNAARDRWTVRQLRRAGWCVMVLWECQISPAKQKELRTSIVRFLGLRRKPRNQSPT